MSQDLRKLFKEQREKEKHVLKKAHEKRFLERLYQALPENEKPGFGWFKIAVSVVVLTSLGFFAYNQFNTTSNTDPAVVETQRDPNNTKGISLGDLSPDLKKLETYYVANINLELSKLEVSDDTEALISTYMKQLNDLNNEYQRLNQELNDVGPNDQTISALIKNLQLRLKLLQQLKKKLNQLKKSKNEQVETNIV